MAYKLGKPYTWDDETDVAEGECCFCGTMIRHFNDGGVGWILGARDHEGKLNEYLYCSNPMCQATRANDAREIHRCYNPNHGHVPNVGQGWTRNPNVPANDYGGYIEFLGDVCPECGGAVADVDARIDDPEWAEFFAKVAP